MNVTLSSLPPGFTLKYPFDLESDLSGWEDEQEIKELRLRRERAERAVDLASGEIRSTPPLCSHCSQLLQS